ncbi:hypothetical protein IGI04_005804 [Brassica rapa subsp. trilocularis]|uniref:DUF577 domain-containing protein n=1 Tax=Brassica rapa subsp. trilocularis TaxID=1813537 RepID=A0ABQ7NF28_BRACM|nr:hypothetical protein IGI04_005804 [Brassica rapa subsp. trilocularis]
METFGFGEDPWFDLWDYIASESEFDKAVYIFQCLTMRFNIGLESFGGSCLGGPWRLRVGFVREIAVKMIDSVKVIVERRMEVGLVRRAFRDLERIVEEQWDWYEAREYRLVKGLLRRLCEIRGMKMESKMVLWRISGTLERNVNEDLRVLSGLDWLNQP